MWLHWFWLEQLCIAMCYTSFLGALLLLCVLLRNPCVPVNWTWNHFLCTGCRLRILKEQRLERYISDLICSLEWQHYSINFWAFPIMTGRLPAEGKKMHCYLLAGLQTNKTQWGNCTFFLICRNWKHAIKLQLDLISILGWEGFYFCCTFMGGVIKGCKYCTIHVLQAKCTINQIINLL